MASQPSWEPLRPYPAQVVAIRGAIDIAEVPSLIERPSQVLTKEADGLPSRPVNLRRHPYLTHPPLA